MYSPKYLPENEQRYHSLWYQLLLFHHLEDLDYLPMDSNYLVEIGLNYLEEVDLNYLEEVDLLH